MRITAAMLTAVAVLYCPSRCSPSLMRWNKPRQAQMQILLPSGSWRSTTQNIE